MTRKVLKLESHLCMGFVPKFYGWFRVRHNVLFLFIRDLGVYTSGFVLDGDLSIYLKTKGRVFLGANAGRTASGRTWSFGIGLIIFEIDVRYLLCEMCTRSGCRVLGKSLRIFPFWSGWPIHVGGLWQRKSASGLQSTYLWCASGNTLAWWMIR